MKKKDKKTTPKRGLMGEKYENHNGARSLVHIDKKKRTNRKRPTKQDKLNWLGD